MSHPDDEIEDSGAPLIEHLAELRTRLIRAVIAFIIGIVIAFTMAEPILQFLVKPIEETLRSLGDPAPTLQYTSPQEYLFTLFRISMVFGFGLAFPVIAHQLWRFVAPGLYRSEKGAFLPFLIASPVMFLLGASFAQFVVTPLAMQFFLGFATDQIHAMPAVREYLSLFMKLLFAFGLSFEIPIILVLATRLGLTTPDRLAGQRRYVIVWAFIAAAILTPPDVISQVLLALPILILFEIGLLLARAGQKPDAAAVVEPAGESEAKGEG